MGPYSALFRCQEDYGGIWCTVLCGSDRPARRSDSTSFLILPPNPIKLNKIITAVKPQPFYCVYVHMAEGEIHATVHRGCFFFGVIFF